MLEQRHMDTAAEVPEPAEHGVDAHQAEGGLRSIVVAAPGSLGPAVVKATITERLGAPRPVTVAELDEIFAHLPADLLLVDARIAGAHADRLAQLQTDYPILNVVAIADRPDEEAMTYLEAAGIGSVLLATDGQAAIALRLRALLHAAAEEPVPAPPESHPSAVMRGLAEELARPAGAVGPEVSQIRSLEWALDRRLMDLMTIGGVARSVSHAEDPLADLTAAAQRMLDADVCFVAAPCTGGASDVLAAAGEGVRPGDVAAAAGEAVQLASGLTAGQRVFVADAQEHPRVPQTLVERTGAVSFVIEPIIAGDRLLGGLVVAWRERVEEPASREVAVLRALAAEAANALERRALLKIMRDVARIDPLTGLPNRAGFDERLEGEVARAARTGEPLALLLLDIDGFKAYNERHGRAGGDALLRAVAAAWRSPLRLSDVIARVGDDAFAILLPDCSPDDAEGIAERLHFATAQLTTFAAILTAWDGQSNAALLMARAESALAQARAAQ